MSAQNQDTPAFKATFLTGGFSSTLLIIPHPDWINFIICNATALLGIFLAYRSKKQPLPSLFDVELIFLLGSVAILSFFKMMAVVTIVSIVAAAMLTRYRQSTQTATATNRPKGNSDE
ncbi:MAG: hypothetical protein BWY68_00328 [bacterium ADurb.Bin400]|nr:MAG: hypothetical protein BWY68_00328 [bacterium ADurb.Bin400]